MKRPFENRRIVGPIFDGSRLNSSGLLEARKKCSPEIWIEIAEDRAGLSEEIFETTRQSKFDIHDVLVGREEGSIGTREPAITTIHIITDEKEIQLEDINHMVDLIKSKFTVFEVKIGGSVEVDPDSVGLTDPFRDREFKQEPTDIE